VIQALERHNHAKTNKDPPIGVTGPKNFQAGFKANPYKLPLNKLIPAAIKVADKATASSGIYFYHNPNPNKAKVCQA